MNIKLVLTFFLINLTCFSFGQHYYFKNFSINEGLLGSNVEDLYQSKDGYLWIASHIGVSKFDGKNFTNYSVQNGLPDARFLSITEDFYGNMWFSTTKSIVKFNGKDFLEYFPSKNESGNFIRAICTDLKGDIWIAANGGVYKLPLSKSDTITQFINYKISDNPRLNGGNGIAVDNNNVVWVITNGGLYKIENDSIYFETKATGNYIAIDNNNNKWMALWSSNENALKMWDGNSISYFGKTIKSPVTAMVVDDDNNIWVSTFANSIFRITYSNKDTIITHFSKKEGFPSVSNWGIGKDREGNIWIGSFGKGIYRYSGDMISYLDKENGLSDDLVNDVGFDAKGRAWITTSYGVNMLSDSNSFYGPKSTITTYKELTGNITVKNKKHIKKEYPKVFAQKGKYNPKKFSFLYSGNVLLNKSQEIVIPTYTTGYTIFIKNDKISLLPLGSGQCGVIDKQGALWLGSDGSGIIKYHNNKIKYYTFKEKNRNYNRIFSLLLDNKDRVWAGCYSNGLRLIEKDSMYVFDFNGRFDNSSLFVLTQTNDNKIWFTTERGILYGGVEKEHQFTITDSLTNNDGLSSSMVVSMFQQSNNDLWIATNKGLNKLNYSKYISTGKIENTIYDKKDGLPSSNITSITEDKNGNLWIGTDAGVAYFNISKQKVIKSKPIVYLKKIELNNGEENINDFSDSINYKLGLPVNLELPYNKNNLTFYFNGIYFSNPNSVRYKYQLIGFDKKESSISEDGKVAYTNLPSGKYKFKIIATHDNINWSKPFEYSFTIATPFWKSLWFLSGIIISLISLIIFYIKRRTYVLKKENEILENKINDRTKKLKLAYDEISDKNKEITDSINYAKSIQTALLTEDAEWKKISKEHFVYLKPKDVVSGDFFWAFNDDKKNLAVWTAADCTGHGVPGAFMSMLGIGFLNEIVIESGVTKPAQILDNLREKIIKALSQKNVSRQQSDGIDMAICVWDKNKNELFYSGANNPLYIISKNKDTIKELDSINSNKFIIKNNDFQLFEIKPDKQPVGFYFGNKSPFSSVTIKLNEGDRIYVFSDGYPDQFGGEKGKKLKYKPFKEILLSISDKNMIDQKTELTSFFTQWKGDLEQIDDVCVIGVRI